MIGNLGVPGGGKGPRPAVADYADYLDAVLGGPWFAMLFESIATLFCVCGTGLGDGKYPIPSGFWLAGVAIVLLGNCPAVR